jgi:DNA-nicking Smr family endonuclease
MAILHNSDRTIKKVDAQTLAKRAAAEGGAEQELTEISDTQAILNPVASQAALSYRIATLQHKVFEDLKAGKIRWFEAVDLHGCTVEQARAVFYKSFKWLKMKIKMSSKLFTVKVQKRF